MILVKVQSISIKSIICKFFILIVTGPASGMNFNRQYFGVTFSPYIKTNTGTDNHLSFTQKNLETMLSLVSGKFSNILLLRYPPETDLYAHGNSLYFNGSDPQLHALEAAIQINKNLNRKQISLILELKIPNNSTFASRNSFRFTYEAAQRANKMVPGMVKGIVLNMNHASFDQESVESLQNVVQVLASGKKYEKRNRTFLIGTIQYCDILFRTGADEILNLTRRIVEITDVLMCHLRPSRTHLERGSKHAVSVLGRLLLDYRTRAKTINPKIVLAGLSSFEYFGSNYWENPTNFEIYWSETNNWATKNMMSFYMIEAIDNPRRSANSEKSPNMGWWKLIDNSQIDSINGYIEKVTEKETKQGKREDGTGPVLVAIMSVVGGIFVVALVAAFLFMYRHIKSFRHKLAKSEIREFFHGNYKSSSSTLGGHNFEGNVVVKPYDKGLEIPKKFLKLEENKLLGSGQFGCVYKAKIKRTGIELDVAVKTLKEDSPRTAMKNLLSEIKILSHIGKHENIVSLEGAYTAELSKGVVYVAIELCSEGSLKSYLRSYSNSQLKGSGSSNIISSLLKIYSNEEGNFSLVVDMRKWCLQIACGMEHLASKHVVHADLAIRNVLLTSDKTAKITDFGLSRKMYANKNYVKKHHEPLPWRSMALESLKNNEFSTASDIWAYGVTIWEIFSMGDTPYPGLSWDLDFVDRLDDGLRLRCPKLATQKIYSMMLLCWNNQPKDRPSFTSLKNELMKIQ